MKLLARRQQTTKLSMKRVACVLSLLAGLCLIPSTALAQGAEAAVNPANTAWILTATALVLFMTIPGLSLFYAGLVRRKNVLSVLMHCFMIMAVMSVLWLVCGY